ncbi:MAG TPA: site-specific integrase [Thermoanaerobaculia bacterium]|jgi:integrase
MRVPGFEYDARRRRAHFDIYVPGSKGEKRRRKTLKNVTRDQALAAWREFRASSTQPEPVSAPHTLRSFVSTYYLTISASLRPSTIQTQRHVIRNHLLRFFGETFLSDITTIRVLDFKTDMRRRSLSGAYINDAVRLLKTLLRQAVERDVITEYPIKKRVPKEPEELPKLELELRERVAFLAAFEDERRFRDLIATKRRLGPLKIGAGCASPRRFGGGLRPESAATSAYFARFHELRDFFLVALETGLRIWSDLRNLRWRDVDLSDGLIRVKTRKTGHEAVIAMSTDCQAALRRYANRLPECEWVFHDETGDRFSESRIRRSFLLAKQLAGLTRRFRPHDLRHTFGCRLASRGVSLQLIAKSLGHTTTQMAERYARPSKEAMRVIADALDADQLPRSAKTRFISNHSSSVSVRRRSLVFARAIRARKEKETEHAGV